MLRRSFNVLFLFCTTALIMPMQAFAKSNADNKIDEILSLYIRLNAKVKALEDSESIDELFIGNSHSGYFTLMEREIDKKIEALHPQEVKLLENELRKRNISRSPAGVAIERLCSCAGYEDPDEYA